MEVYGDEGDVCDCGHLYCYHLADDSTDGTIAGCQIVGCGCKKVWKGENDGN